MPGFRFRAPNRIVGDAPGPPGPEGAAMPIPSRRTERLGRAHPIIPAHMALASGRRPAAAVSAARSAAGA